ncbi:MAG: single-stranded-DNA-specific exonuclease RecJ [Desulfitobacteriaceae bacterium]|nr:single-stranded-DNA-specific exonuclease RecJ [Desulfitobacteriaceae bacterium]
MKQCWLIPETKNNKTFLLSELLAISPIVADILARRGLQEVRKAVDYLRPTMLSLASPYCFKDMSRIIERLTKALRYKEKVLVYGDFDVDGVTSTALLYKVLVDLGFKAVTYIPHRQEEGYGLHQKTIEKASRAGVKVLITVDCGITAFEEIKFANESGIDVVITDHHEPLEILPPAYAIIDPKVEDSGYPFRELAGVGVAFKLVQALLQEFQTAGIGLKSQKDLLDFVALGTIADVVPLIGENRVLVFHGLKQMECTTNPGIKALLVECGLQNKSLKAGSIAFLMAPRINSVGRMDSARPGLELLLTANPQRAQELARMLSAENALRQKTEKEILTEAVTQLEQGPLPSVIVLASENWHHGVIGIVASRLVERYHRPVFIISVEGKLSKGSARGIPGYHVLKQLCTQAGLLERFGGHRQAAGFTIATGAIAQLKEGLNAEADKLPEEVFQKKLTIDRFVDFSMLTESLQQELDQLAPFGYGNSGPILAVRQLPVYKLSQVGKNGSHLKLHVGPRGVMEGIAFSQGERINELLASTRLDLAFSLDINTFKGCRQLQLVVKDVQNEAKVQDKINQTAILSDNQGQNPRKDSVVPKVLDWRNYERNFWLRKVMAITKNNLENSSIVDKIVIWDSTLLRTVSLEDFCKNKENTGSNSSLLENNCLNPPVLGIIVGIPFTRDDLRFGLESILSLGVGQIALTEFKPRSELELQKRSVYLSRQKLVQKYRYFQKMARTENPFCWKPLESEQNSLEALKIFEELGLVRYLGSSDLFVIELLPSEQKLDLEVSLRYASSKRYWKRVTQFQKHLLGISRENIMLLVEKIVKEEIF